MQVATIQGLLTAWAQFQPQDTNASKAKDLFLKVHDGKLIFEKRAELPNCIVWLTAKHEYEFNENIKELRTILSAGYAERAQLSTQEKAHLQELQTAHNELIERYERKNIHGIIGRILIFLGLYDYSEAIAQAVEAQRYTYKYEDTLSEEMDDTDPFEGIVGTAGSVGIMYDMRDIEDDYVDVESGRGELLQATPLTHAQMVQALQELPAKIDAFQQTKTSPHQDVEQLRQEIADLQQALQAQADGALSTELLERYAHIDALFFAIQLV